MKTTLLMIFLSTVAGICLVVTSFGYAPVVPFSGALNATPTHNPGIPYFYLSNPQMVTTNNNGTYFVINDDKLLVFDCVTDVEEFTIQPDAVFMRFVGNHLFIFYAGVVHIYNPANLSNLPVIVHLANNSLASRYFDVHHISGVNRYRIFHACDRYFASRDLSSTLILHSIVPASSTFSDLGMTIRGITSDNAGGVFTVVADFWDFETIFHGESNTPLFPPRLHNITSVAYVPGHNSLVIISNATLSLFNRTTSEFIPLPPATGDRVRIYYTTDSVEPLFVTARADGNILVIDRVKKSIDEYKITPNGLVFANIIAASSGKDSGEHRGFYLIPQSMTLIGPDEYVVADRAGQIRRVSSDQPSRPFLRNDTTAMDIRAMVYDNFEFIYMWDFYTQRILQFNRDGSPGRIFNQTFTNVVQLVADFNQNIYVLVAPNRVYRLHDNRTEFVHHSTRPVISTTRAVYTFSDGLVFCDAPQVAAVAQGTTILGLAICALGNLLVLSEDNGNYYINDEHIENLTVGRLPSMQYDRITNNLYIIGSRHAVEVVAMDLWTFSEADHPEINHSAQSVNDNKFLQVNRNTLVFQYPNGINAIARASHTTPQTSILKILALADLSIDVNGNTYTFPFHYVIYENSVTGVFQKGYVLADPNTTPITPGISNARPYSTNFGFYLPRNPTGNVARVIFSNTPIYKFPTTSFVCPTQGTNIILGRLQKIPVTQLEGLILRHRVDIRDSRGNVFYEILLRFNGTYYEPDPIHGTYVGYILSTNVIDFHRPESAHRFVPNGSVIFPTTTYRDGLQVYSFDGQNFIPMPGEFLYNNQRILIVGTFNRDSEFTQIRYWDGYMYRNGWVRTKYVFPNTITALQIIALVTLIIIVLGTIAYFIYRIRRKRAI